MPMPVLNSTTSSVPSPSAAVRRHGGHRTLRTPSALSNCASPRTRSIAYAVTHPMRVVDLTQPWGDRMPTWPQFASIKVTDITTHHRDRKSTLLVETNMHTGTHTDAPIHYSETGMHLGEIPLADLIGTGLVLDLRRVTRLWSYYSLDDVLG